MFRGIYAVILAAMITACGGPKIVVDFAPPMEKEIFSIAVTSGNILFTESLTSALELRGMRTLPPEAVTEFARKFRATPLDALKAAGIDAYVHAQIVGPYHKPESILLLVKDNDGKLIRELTWINAWRGVEGSLASYHAKRSALEAVDEIADTLVEVLRPPKRPDETAMAPTGNV